MLRWSAPLLVAVIVLAYVPSLSGGYLSWDDSWLVADNARLHHARLSDWIACWTDLSLATRMQFGAEFLPIRDASWLLESRLIGLAPASLRLVNLAIYVGAILLLRRALRSVSKDPWAPEIVTWLFALHPAHVESVAWIAGRKDVLALLFVAAAADVYARRGRYHVAGTAVLLALALLSKSMSIAALALLPLLDLAASRPLQRRALAAAGVVAVAIMPLHIFVGRVVGMTEPLAGGSRLSALATMGPVWARYLGCMLWPGQLSLVHDVPTRTAFDAASLGGYALLAGWAAGAWVLWRRHQSRGAAIALLSFVVPLAPVSQVLFALQNRMADRYLWLSVLAPGVLAATLARRSRTAGAVAAVLFGALCLVGTVVRSSLFADSEAVFLDATEKTRLSTAAPYQLALAMEEAGDSEGAIRMYEETWRRYEAVLRDQPLDAAHMAEPARRATNNLARALGHKGAWEQAQAVLERGLRHFPTDAKMVDNLNKVVARRAASRGQ